MSFIREITPASEEWPAEALAVLSDDDRPERLWVRGDANLRDLVATSVAVIGSRSATPYGVNVAIDMACALAEQGYTIVSGGAFGIDQAAHRGALAARVPTVIVSASGVDRPYPTAHTELFGAVVDRGGLVISENQPGSAPTRERFLGRNRLIVALSQGTVIVEGSARSGARSTANWATKIGRPLFAVPGPITSVTSGLPHELIRESRARLVTESQHVTDYLKELA